MNALLDAHGRISDESLDERERHALEYLREHCSPPRSFGYRWDMFLVPHNLGGIRARCTAMAGPPGQAMLCCAELSITGAEYDFAKAIEDTLAGRGNAVVASVTGFVERQDR